MATKKGDWQAMLEEWFTKLPALPKGGKDFLVMIAPWGALIGGILAVLGGISVFGLSAVLTPFMMMGGYGGHSFLTGIILIVAGVLMLMAFPGLKAKKMKGWNLYFWSVLVWVVSSILDYSIVSAIIWGAVELYLLYQIKPSYK